MKSDQNPHQSVLLRIEDWPFLGRSRTISLDRAIAADEQSIRDYCNERYGEGRLRASGEMAYEYHRSVALPWSFKNLFAKLLNKSY